jgi:acyl-CoA thioesterase FadM
MRREFSAPYTVRYDEVDCFGLLKPAAFVRYMQDIAWRDAADARLDGDGFWVVKRSVLRFNAPVAANTVLDLYTYALGFTRVTAQRAYDAYTRGEPRREPLVSGRTLWVYLDARGRPGRLPARTSDIWLPDGPVEQQPEVPLPTFPQAEPAHMHYTIQFSDLDIMKHYNNASYVELLDNAGWDACAGMGITPDTTELHACEYEIEYNESARLGQQVDVHTWWDPSPPVTQENIRYQRVTSDNHLLVQARSRWRKQAVEV